MRKILIGVVVFLSAAVLRAELPDVVKSTLLDHVSTVSQFKSGETKVALVDSVVLIGNYKGRSILDLQLGLSAETNAEEGEPSGGNFIYGGLLKLSSLTKDKINFPSHWSFLNSLEYGIGYFYDDRSKKDYAAFQVGLAFGLNPIQ